MKVGADNPKKTVAAIALFALALSLTARTFLSGGSAAASGTSKPAQASLVPQVPSPAGTGTAGPASRRSNLRRNAQNKKNPEPSFTASLDPRLRLDLLSVAEQTEYGGSGRNIFRMQAEP